MRPPSLEFVEQTRVNRKFRRLKDEAKPPREVGLPIEIDPLQLRSSIERAESAHAAHDLCDTARVGRDANAVDERPVACRHPHELGSDREPRHSTFGPAKRSAELLEYLTQPFEVEIPEGELFSDECSSFDGIASIIARLSNQ